MSETLEEISVHLSASGVTVYATTGALRRIQAAIARLIESDPAENYEMHIVQSFATLTESGSWTDPSLTFADGMDRIVVDWRDKERLAAIHAGNLDRDAELAPFEVTLMHVRAVPG